MRAADLLISDKLSVEALGEARIQALLRPGCKLTVARDKRSRKRGVNVSDGVQDEINEQGALSRSRARCSLPFPF